MRLRITRNMCGSIDGIKLDSFKVGEVYDVGISLAHYLMGCGFALPVADERPARLIPLDQDVDEPPRSTTNSDRSMSADRAESRYLRGDFSKTQRRSSKRGASQ